jgi:hypothetical protein
VPHPCAFFAQGWDSTKALKHLRANKKQGKRIQEFYMHDDLHHARSLGLSVALGGAMGAAIGAATGHIGIWVAAGIAAYIAITLVGGASQNKQ